MLGILYYNHYNETGIRSDSEISKSGIGSPFGCSCSSSDLQLLLEDKKKIKLLPLISSVPKPVFIRWNHSEEGGALKILFYIKLA